jgi:hypothetical protein
LKGHILDSRSVLGDELNNFIEEYVDSFVKWDLVTFFSFNPDESGTSEDLAARLGRKTEEIEEALENLTEKKLLKLGEKDKTYSFSPSEELRDKVKAFCDALEDRDKRLEILAKLLRMKATN